MPITELFNYPTCDTTVNWSKVIENQHCNYINRKCVKIRKSMPSVSIGTCSVAYGQNEDGIIICPHRLLESRKIFMDSIHLLTKHEPGNDLHIVSELSIPGGSVDYFLASCHENRVVDFVGIELQTLDTTGSLWPARQRFLFDQGIEVPKSDLEGGTFGMNWKMTAKTILVQLHHKIETFEHLGKHLVLVLQQELLNYMKKEFSFDHISERPMLGHSMHFHAYTLNISHNCHKILRLSTRMSTDANGISTCLGLQAQAKVELDIILKAIQSKITEGRSSVLNIT